MSAVVQLDNVTKQYGSGAAGARAVSDVSLAVAEGEFLTLMGPSGCGKSTLLNLIAGLEIPTSGRVLVCGEDLSRLSDKALSDLRLRYLGFVFQSFTSELSGGEQQRVAAARALATEPKLLLADEPTGNLDSTSGRNMLDLLRSMNVQRRMSVVMATHDSFAGTYGHRTIGLKDGRIVREAGEMEAPPSTEGQVVPFRRKGE
jgi:putative ABC transport system ATP-binding protein